MDLLYVWGHSEDGNNKDCLLFPKISDRLNTIILQSYRKIQMGEIKWWSFINSNCLYHSSKYDLS